eukprot:1143672-Pelagomonas_calceolata.AAC.6
MVAVLGNLDAWQEGYSQDECHKDNHFRIKKAFLCAEVRDAAKLRYQSVPFYLDTNQKMI